MEFSNSFAVEVPVERVWAMMLDAQQVAPCVPGAELTESIDELHHRGVVKVKLGAMQMTYRGELEMQPDENSRVIVLKARGSEARGGGGASGTFTTTLSPTDSGGTQVDILTRVDVTGRVAQFGRGIMQDVANRMMRDFAACLQRKASEGSGETAQTVEAATKAEASPEVEVSTPAPALATAPGAAPTSVAPAAAAEIRVGKLVLDITRSKVAAGLRLLARVVEP